MDQRISHLKDLSEQELRGLLRKLHDDEAVAINAKVRADAHRQIGLVDAELKRRFEGRHPVRKAVYKVLGFLGVGK